jgi:hypothetical protein
MFFGPVFPAIVFATMKLDSRFAEFVRGAEIIMWAAPDEMHRAAAMLAGWSVVCTKGACSSFSRHKHPDVPTIH